MDQRVDQRVDQRDKSEEESYSTPQAFMSADEESGASEDAFLHQLAKILPTISDQEIDRLVKQKANREYLKLPDRSKV